MTTPMPPDRLEALKKLCDAAAPGPWYPCHESWAELNDICVWNKLPDGTEDERNVICGMGNVIEPMCPEAGARTMATAKFIAESRIAFPELIREVKRQRDEILQLAGEAMRTAKEVPISDDEIERIADDVCRKGK